jgi:hypothetical protein
MYVKRPRNWAGRPYIFAQFGEFGCYSRFMNKRSVKKKRPAKASRSSAVRKSPARATVGRASAARKATAARQPARKPDSISAVKITAIEMAAAVTVAQVTALGSALRTHKFQVGQTVFYTSSPISRPGASGTYQVVRLLPSDGEDYQYRIKNPGEAFERVAKESQLDIEH